MRPFTIIGVALAAGTALAATGAAAQRSFDGNWSVEVVTQKGDCDKAYRYPVTIQNGRVRYGGSEGFEASGSVAASGAVQGSISRGNDRASVRGRLSGRSGSGTWTAGGNRTCSGQWFADKRG